MYAPDAVPQPSSSEEPASSAGRSTTSLFHLPILLALDERAPKILFGGERIMGLTPLGKVPRGRIAALRVRVHVVLLQKSGLSAPLTLVVDKCAARSVAIPHFAAYLR